MCGIIGWFNGGNGDVGNRDIRETLRKLYCLSESRGKEASGLCLMDDDTVTVYKRPIRAKYLISSPQYQKIISEIDSNKKFLAFGHARMVTNGDSWKYQNNQPVVKKDLICVHNGIIVNDGELWEEIGENSREFEVDTEVFLTLLDTNNYKENIVNAFNDVIKKTKGSITTALVDKNSDYLLLYTNTGSLYYIYSKKSGNLVFASERYILEQILTNRRITNAFAGKHIIHVKEGEGYILDMQSNKLNKLNSETQNSGLVRQGNKNRKYVEVGKDCDPKPEIMHYNIPSVNRNREIEKLFFKGSEKIIKLRRCTKCLLPETFPGISFDSDGVCSVCNEYKYKKVIDEDALENQIANSKKEKDRYDCIIPISGGRDSCYMLHYLVKEMHLRPIAYTYDWGMVTDLARRNIQLMCSELGVEHILISADIRKKRRNIRLNVQAWLNKPTLSTVPLFMAGDKQFFYYAQLLKKQLHISSIVFGMNALEETQFKVRFANVQSGKKGSVHYDLSGRNKMKLATNYGMEFVKNPAFINKSMIDSLSGFLSYYMLPKDYLQFFDYVKWDESEIEDTLINVYGWETDPHTSETWRIGDGTASFYNYIYYKMAGFTEFDTFRSNQIRQGMISREEGLKRIGTTNPSIQEDFVWYCDTIGIDPINALKIINRQKTLY